MINVVKTVLDPYNTEVNLWFEDSKRRTSIDEEIVNSVERRITDQITEMVIEKICENSDD